jgi:hypothetical protein
MPLRISFGANTKLIQNILKHDICLGYVNDVAVAFFTDVQGSLSANCITFE